MSTVRASQATEQQISRSIVDIDIRFPKDKHLEEANQARQAQTETHIGQPGAWFLYDLWELKSCDATTARDALQNASAIRRAHQRYKRMPAHAFQRAWMPEVKRAA